MVCLPRRAGRADKAPCRSRGVVVSPVDPDLLMKWFTPRPWRTVEAEIDLVLGGVFRTRMQGPGGEEGGGTGCILEVVRERRPQNTMRETTQRCFAIGRTLVNPCCSNRPSVPPWRKDEETFRPVTSSG